MDKILLAIDELITAEIGVGKTLESIKSVWQGKPPEISERDLPAVYIVPIRTPFDHEGSGTRTDQRKQIVNISLVLNKKDYFGQESTDSKKVFVQAKAAELIEGTNDVQGIKSDTICGIIQNNQRLPYTGGNNASIMALVQSVDYDTINDAGEDIYGATIEVEVTTRGDR